MPKTLFANIPAAPADPILGVMAQFNADPRAQKVNLSVGMYMDENGKVPLLNVVRAEEEALAKIGAPHVYTAIRGLPIYCDAVQQMVFGADSEVYRSKRAATVQTLGGTGALKVGVDFLKHVIGSNIGAASNPTWGNHNSIIKFAGCELKNYRYYDRANDCVDFNAMVEDLSKLPAGSFAILHSCCHNPTGYDLSHEQWKIILDLCIKNGIIPFLDMAYQGFSKSLTEDAYAIRLFADSGINFLVATSYSKSFGLYAQRIGALTVVTQSEDEAKRILTQVEGVIRCNYSNPPTHGGHIVQNVLSDPAKYAQWEAELACMRDRIRSMREALVSEMQALGTTRDFSFVTRQAGMFSFTGFTPEQMERLSKEYGIYGVRNGRICICGLNPNNVSYVAKAFCEIL